MTFCWEANCSAHFFMCTLSRLFTAIAVSFIVCHTNLPINRVSKEHFTCTRGLAAGAASQSGFRGFPVLCGLDLSLPSWHVSIPHCLARTQRVLMLQGLLFSYISSEVEKVTDERRSGGSRCSFTIFILLLTGGVKIKKMLYPRMEESFLFWPKNNVKMLVTEVCYRTSPLTVSSCGSSEALGLGTLCKVFNRKCSMVWEYLQGQLLGLFWHLLTAGKSCLKGGRGTFASGPVCMNKTPSWGWLPPSNGYVGWVDLQLYTFKSFFFCAQA